ncbi:MAG: PQQ-binding-like beta-propeller repeat protein [Ferruginibacter sp.]|nr:PQQ-binding-like beta-propeller repeat protein [Chitinophagaceae bacterium]
MRKTFLPAATLLLCLGVWDAGKMPVKQKPVAGTSHSKQTKQQNPDDSARYEKDILPQILALNSDERFKPKKDFRKGHVTVTTLDKQFEKTADGFCIQLSSRTNIPTPAVINGNLYISGGFGSKEYYSFDAATGGLKWAISLDDDGPSSPAVEDGIIVFNTESCTIFACDLLTGKQIWSYWLGDPLMSMPTIANGIVYTSYPAHYEGGISKPKNDTANNQLSIFPSHVLIAFDLKTGDIRWQKWIDSDIMSAPVAKDELLYLTTFSGALYKIEQKSGEILEAKAIRATSAPVFDNNNELIISRRTDNARDSVASESLVRGMGLSRGYLYNKQAHYLDERVQVVSGLKTEAAKMDAGNGFTSGAPTSSNWQAANKNIGQSNVASLQSFQGSRALYQDGHLYHTMGDEIVCTDSSGVVKWKHALEGDLKKQGGFMGTPPVYANGYIIIATLSGEVLIMDAKVGKIIKKYLIKDPVRYQPIAEKGWIYVTTVNSKLYAINTGNPAITGWNMWGGNAARTNKTRVK